MDIQKLIKIADSLDDKGFIKEAEEIDQLIHMASITIKNMQGLLTVLKDTFAEAVNNPNLPSITKESLHDIFQVLDAAGKDINFPIPYKQSPEQAYALIKQLGDKAYDIGTRIINLEDDIKKSEEALKGATDENDHKQITREIEADKEKLRQFTIEILKWKTGKRPEDKVNWEKLQAFLKQRGRGI